MALPNRPLDAADLLRNLTQASQPTAPDNPAELLTDYVTSSTGTGDDVAITDAISTPDTPHGGTYLYNDATSLYNRAQWS